MSPDPFDHVQAGHSSNWFNRFLPRSNSRAVFLFTVTCYALSIGLVEGRIVKALGLWPQTIDPIRHVVRTVRLGAEHSPAWTALLLAPVFESLLVIGLIELLRRIKCSIAAQIVAPALFICLLHSAFYIVWGFFAAPLFFIGAASYVYWRRTSFWTGMVMMILIHFFWNGVEFLLVLAR